MVRHRGLIEDGISAGYGTHLAHSCRQQWSVEAQTKLDPCDFCADDLPKIGQVGLTMDGRRYVFCDEECRDRFREKARVRQPILDLGPPV
jgi:YHS domain-containing protein